MTNLRFACEDGRIPLHVLPPRRPQWNGCVERPENANTWFSSRFRSLAAANQRQLEQFGENCDIPQDEESRLMIGFNRNPGDTYPDCDP